MWSAIFPQEICQIFIKGANKNKPRLLSSSPARLPALLLSPTQVARTVDPLPENYYYSCFLNRLFFLSLSLTADDSPSIHKKPPVTYMLGPRAAGDFSLIAGNIDFTLRYFFFWLYWHPFLLLNSHDTSWFLFIDYHIDSLVFFFGFFFACARAMSRRSIKALRLVLTGSVKVQLCGAFECSGTARSRAGLNSVWAEVCQRWSSRHHRMSTGFTPRFSLGHSQSAAPPHTRWQKYSGSVPK